MVYASALIGIFECLPLGFLQIVYSLRCHDAKDVMGTLSLITTWCMLVRHFLFYHFILAFAKAYACVLTLSLMHVH